MDSSSEHYTEALLEDGFWIKFAFALCVAERKGEGDLEATVRDGLI